MEWKQINNYPNYYINTLGEIKSNYKNKLLKPNTDKDGYKIVYLYKDKISKSFRVHRLVGIHFLPNWNNYREIDHLNRNRDDNRLINLRWCNRSMNTLNSGKRTNTYSQYKGVSFDKRSGKWFSFYKKKNLGYAGTEEDAKNNLDNYKFNIKNNIPIYNNRMPSRWIEFVKEFAAKNNITYGCALTKPELKTEYWSKYPKEDKGKKEPVKVVEEEIVIEPVKKKRAKKEPVKVVEEKEEIVIEPVKKKRVKKAKAKVLEPLTLPELPDLEDF